jgi:hypothetical protein
MAKMVFLGALKPPPPGEILVIRAADFEPAEEDFQLQKATGREVKKVARKNISKTGWVHPEKNLL